MKKLISIGVALALLTMAVVPAAVSADIQPTRYSKIPFAIIGSGFYLLENIMDAMVTGGMLPAALNWLPALMPKIGDWTAVPLAWSVDMLAWGVGLMAAVWTDVNTMFTIGMPEISNILLTVEAGLKECWSTACNETAYSP